jgi:hypothetical protein
VKEIEETKPETQKPNLVDTAKEAAVGAVVTVVVTAVATAAVGGVVAFIQNRRSTKDEKDEK